MGNNKSIKNIFPACGIALAMKREIKKAPDSASIFSMWLERSFEDFQGPHQASRGRGRATLTSFHKAESQEWFSKMQRKGYFERGTPPPNFGSWTPTHPLSFRTTKKCFHSGYIFSKIPVNLWISKVNLESCTHFWIKFGRKRWVRVESFVNSHLKIRLLKIWRWPPLP